MSEEKIDFNMIDRINKIVRDNQEMSDVMKMVSMLHNALAAIPQVYSREVLEGLMVCIATTLANDACKNHPEHGVLDAFGGCNGWGSIDDEAPIHVNEMVCLMFDPYKITGRGRGVMLEWLGKQLSLNNKGEEKNERHGCSESDNLC